MIRLPPQTRVKGVGRQQQQFLEFVLDSVYADLQYEILLLLLLGLWSFGCLSPVCEVVLVPYVAVVVAVTVIYVMLFVLHVCMLRECEGDRNVGVGDGGDMVMVSAWHVGGTRGSCIVSSAADVLGMSVVRGMRGVGGVCEMCLCLALVA